MADRFTIKTPSDREAVLLQALIAGEKYGLELRDAYEAATKQRMPLGALYTTLERMEGRGFVASRYGESTSETGGNRRRYFRLKPVGLTAINQYRDRLANMAGLFASVRTLRSLRRS